MDKDWSDKLKNATIFHFYSTVFKQTLWNMKVNTVPKEKQVNLNFELAK